MQVIEHTTPESRAAFCLAWRAAVARQLPPHPLGQGFKLLPSEQRVASMFLRRQAE